MQSQHGDGSKNARKTAEICDLDFSIKSRHDVLYIPKRLPNHTHSPGIGLVKNKEIGAKNGGGSWKSRVVSFIRSKSHSMCCWIEK